MSEIKITVKDDGTKVLMKAFERRMSMLETLLRTLKKKEKVPRHERIIIRAPVARMNTSALESKMDNLLDAFKSRTGNVFISSGSRYMPSPG